MSLHPINLLEWDAGKSFVYNTPDKVTTVEIHITGAARIIDVWNIDKIPNTLQTYTIRNNCKTFGFSIEYNNIYTLEVRIKV